MLYGDDVLYGAELFDGPGYTGTWTGSYSFDYLAGTTVFVTLVPVWSVCTECQITLYAGESTGTLELVEPSTKTPITFNSTTSGTANLYVRAMLDSQSFSKSPVLSELLITIEQSTSLYTVAVKVLEDGLSGTGVGYSIDAWLRSVPIEYSWITPKSHRKAIAQIAEASGGICYQDRYGEINLIASATGSGASCSTIGQDRIYNASSPVSEVFNDIRVTTQPAVLGTETTVWELVGDTLIDDGETRTFDIFFNDYVAVVTPYASLTSTPSGATIDSETWYSWGGSVTITGSSDGQDLSLSVLGQPITISGSRILRAYDAGSIRRNGQRVLSITDNGLIQGAEQAQSIANAIVAVTADERRDVEFVWRGNPALELGDCATVDSVEGIVVSQEIEFTGILQATGKVRKE